jgi:hypothetical protein
VSDLLKSVVIHLLNLESVAIVQLSCYNMELTTTNEMTMNLYDAATLRQTLSYDPLTGVFTWLVPVRLGPIGSQAGRVDKNGYRRIAYGGKHYVSSRLAWLYVHDELPDLVDHENGNRDDNRLDNLRNVSHALNMQNQKRAHVNNLSGLLGVGVRGDRFTARIQVDKKPKFLGYFSTPELAHAAYLEAKRKLHPAGTL